MLSSGALAIRFPCWNCPVSTLSPRGAAERGRVNAGIRSTLLGPEEAAALAALTRAAC